MTKIAGSGSGSGSTSQKHGSEDPNRIHPQNVMDPEHCFSTSTTQKTLAIPAAHKNVVTYSKQCKLLHHLQPVLRILIFSIPDIGSLTPDRTTTSRGITVVYMVREVMILMRENTLQGPLEGVGPENRDFSGLEMATSKASAILGPKKSRLFYVHEFTSLPFQGPKMSISRATPSNGPPPPPPSPRGTK